MTSEKTESSKNAFQTLWDGAKHEIFRLQLLNTYWEDTRLPTFKEFMAGKPVDYINSPGYREWAVGMAKKRDEGVKIINLQVLDLPLSDALRFGIGFLRISEENGQHTLFVERQDVKETIKGFEDYYLFDSQVALPIIYDKDVEGRFIKFGSPVRGQTASRYVEASVALVKAAVPMEEFLRNHGIDANVRSRQRSVGVS